MCIIIFVARTNEIMVNVFSTIRKLLSIYVGYAVKPWASTWYCGVGISCFWCRLTEETKLRFLWRKAALYRFHSVSVADLLQQIPEHDMQVVNH